MIPVSVAVLIGLACAVVSALTTMFVQSRWRVMQLTDEADQLVIRISDFESRLTRAEARATGAEERLAHAEARAQEFRRSVIVIGERLDIERARYRRTVVKLVSIIDHLMYCIENPGGSKDIDKAAISGLTTQILGEYPIETFITV